MTDPAKPPPDRFVVGPIHLDLTHARALGWSEDSVESIRGALRMLEANGRHRAQLQRPQQVPHGGDCP